MRIARSRKRRDKGGRFLRYRACSWFEGRPIILGDFNLLEVQSRILNLNLGSCNVLEVRSSVLPKEDDVDEEPMFGLGDACVLGVAVQFHGAIGKPLQGAVCAPNPTNEAVVTERIGDGIVGLAGGEAAGEPSGPSDGAVEAERKELVEDYKVKHKKNQLRHVEILKESLQKCHYLQRTKPEGGGGRAITAAGTTSSAPGTAGPRAGGGAGKKPAGAMGGAKRASIVESASENGSR